MLTFQFVPFSQVGSMSSEEKVRHLLTLAKEEKILLLEGRLKSNEKSELIRKTMEEISDRFKGIEIEELDIENRDKAFSEKFRAAMVNLLMGNRQGLTIIGPATIIKEIKKDPDKIQFFTEEAKAKKKR